MTERTADSAVQTAEGTLMVESSTMESIRINRIAPGATGGITAALAVAGLAVSGSASASFLPPEVMDKAAMYIAWFVIIMVPIGGVVLFWLVHVLPEKIAHKRHHPQRDAIQTLCLLSLVFGGLLWPLAWLWAYTKPVAYRGAYGTERHDDYFREMGEKALAGELTQVELAFLREELDKMAAKGPMSVELGLLRRELAAAKPAAAQTAPAAAADAKAGSA